MGLSSCLGTTPPPLLQPVPEWSHFPSSSKTPAHVGQLCPALAAEGELSVHTSGLSRSRLCFHVDRASLGPHVGCPYCCRTRLHRALCRGLAATSDRLAHLWRSDVCVVDVPSPWSLLLGSSWLEGYICRELCAVEIPLLCPASFFFSPAIKYC